MLFAVFLLKRNANNQMQPKLQHFRSFPTFCCATACVRYVCVNINTCAHVCMCVHMCMCNAVVLPLLDFYRL